MIGRKQKTYTTNIITGTGSALPKKVLSNEDLATEKGLDTTHEWIVARTGIHQRHVSGEGETTATLAVEAARHALGNAGLLAEDIDLIVVGTSTPDYTFPSVACLIQKALHTKPCPAFDVQAVCSGFVNAFFIANTMLNAGEATKALVVGADTFSKLLNWEDRGTAVLFGDGAGAVVLERKELPVEDGSGKKLPQRGIIGGKIWADGRYTDLLRATGGVASGEIGHTIMNGREVFKHASRTMAEMVDDALERYKIKKKDIAYLVPHQANRRIIEASAKYLDIPMERVVLTVDLHANTSAASVPLALDEGARRGMFREGDLILTEAFGAGFTWGYMLLRW